MFLFLIALWKFIHMLSPGFSFKILISNSLTTRNVFTFSDFFSVLVNEIFPVFSNNKSHTQTRYNDEDAHPFKTTFHRISAIKTLFSYR